ncbi:MULTISPECIES: HD domain-containing phosphohydrolase [unclassified Herbaspirillum]|uniref:HD-GYP domain-containing protein n=1 Tax=unclassified Herbaspirillum TaxID=2624150 RepID=UPI000E2F0777|nr:MULTISPECIES: HD domain-containing phosphohydrolase [unclassified Herbaspirillum]RFB68112.1 HD domain-containing protein [Herbaspirillum sp. 3R-3a1]TFI06557.1 HD domain-containing protein [Herbaspirillum sp. 3R11]TFI13831.1 HD domain-containing protein [Herbaspirillum sp. 3R-11]TFI29275.1 HD domain-containing protein [Herbaspirillum sp. 3C11]
MSDLSDPLHQLQTQALDALLALQDLIDNYTPLHEDRVATLALQIGRRMKLDAPRLQALHMAARVHDIGKVDIPLDILNKPGKLNDAEFALIKTHAQTSYDVLKRISFTLPVADIVHAHHEYLDGSGYPRGLRGDDILPEARILTVADIVESMSEDRPYRKSLGMPAALEEISRLRGIRLDPDAVDACLQVCGNAP